MEKIIMLGTGHGFVWNLYNTCFLLENGEENLLVDTGGGIEIVKNLEKIGYKITDIQNIFISHCHTDHILGLLWILKKMSGLFSKGYDKPFNIYCNYEVANSIKGLYSKVFPDVRVKAIDEKINIHILHDEENINIAGENITFFDVHAKGNLLYGFETILNNGTKLIFLGDETCNPILYDRIRDADYVMHEAFCLDAEESKFKAYEKHHSTVKSVCESMQPLNIKNLILFHTEDTHENKKELYTNEAKMYYSGHVIVPNDLDEIILKKKKALGK